MSSFTDKEGSPILFTFSEEIDYLMIVERHGLDRKIRLQLRDPETVARLKKLPKDEALTSLLTTCNYPQTLFDPADYDEETIDPFNLLFGIRKKTT